ncbi:YaaL family protein [Shouchella plakortidis]|uniref:YaaL family protein n=1 Tax=Alkalicoccobacillus plakortidis TaxID=444060 RepID=A0ABT0XKP8_9BACI|nr:YaaL family protein [Alkalicoccobacillus plakortidis]
MFFRKKGKLRMEENERLLNHIEVTKERYDNQRQLIEHSVDPSEDVISRMKLTEAKYSFLIREARIRRARKNSL